MEQLALSPRPTRAPLRGERVGGAYVIPGVFGEEPAQARFRSRLSGHVDLELLDLPDIHSPRRLLTDMAATARRLSDEILTRQPTGSIALLGFSFGASVALEVAGQIERRGREISYLGILDGPFDALITPAPGSAPPIQATPGRILKSVVKDAVATSPNMRRLAMSVASLGSPDPDPGEPMRRAILWHLRSRALSQWVPTTCRAPGLHVTTGCYGDDNRNRWAHLCPMLKHVHIPVIHERLMHGEALEQLLLVVKASLDDLENGPEPLCRPDRTG